RKPIELFLYQLKSRVSRRPWTLASPRTVDSRSLSDNQKSCLADLSLLAHPHDASLPLPPRICNVGVQACFQNSARIPYAEPAGTVVHTLASDHPRSIIEADYDLSCSRSPFLAPAFYLLNRRIRLV